jgi:hypothetical protein
MSRNKLYHKKCSSFFSVVTLEMSAAIIQFFFTMRDQIKLYHWSTMSYARHKATCEAIERLDKNIDRFTEVYIGKYSRPKMRTLNYKVEQLTDKKAMTYIHECTKVLQGALMKGLTAEKDSDLFTIRDEMLADLNQLIYLFTLH